MAYGVQISNGSGVERLTPDDFIHRLWATGSVTAPGGFSPVATDVAVAGMSASDAWIVVTAGPQAITLGADKFTVTNYSFGSTVYYSVYRL